MEKGRYKSYLLLHIIVLIFGFTGVLGQAITLPSERIVWFRVFIAVISLFFYGVIFKKNVVKVTKVQLLQYISVGFIVALHWITFFESIKISNVSVALASLSSGALFTSFLEPLINKKKFLWYEMILGILIVVGLILIFNLPINRLRRPLFQISIILHNFQSTYLSSGKLLATA